MRAGKMRTRATAAWVSRWQVVMVASIVEVFYGRRRACVNHIGNLRTEMSNSGYRNLTLPKRRGNGMSV